jgi:hypothetical protein
MHCTMLIWPSFAYVLDDAETEFEEPVEQAQVEEFTNLELDQGKPRCI